jgi:hypothetical protein
VSPRRSEDGILETQRLVDGLFCTCVCQPAASLFFSCCRGTARRSTTSDFTGDFFSAHAFLARQFHHSGLKIDAGLL